MQKLLKTIALVLFSSITNSQTNIIDVYDDIVHVVPQGTYLKDINNTFDIFLGTWKWQEGNKILIIKVEKVTQYYYPEYGTFQDFIKANYSYTVDNGNTYIVNTINQNLGNNNPEENAMYSSGSLTQSEIGFTFKDIVYNKERCSALFKFLPNTTSQVKLSLSNDHFGYLLPDTPPNPNFSIPNNVILTKQ
jgi:hypothetical protein